MVTDLVALSAPVRIKLLVGARKKELAKLKSLLDALPTFQPQKTTWELLDSWAIMASQNGQNFGFGDLLIGAFRRSPYRSFMP